MIEISPALNEARLGTIGTLGFLDSGAAQARVRVYDGTRPAGGAAPAGTMLVEIRLTKPAGVVDAGLLELAQSTTIDLIAVSGSATWARVVNANGDWAFDCDVSGTGGSGEVQLASTTLFAGGRVAITSAILG